MLSCLLQGGEFQVSAEYQYREHQGLVYPQFDGERETLIFPDSIKRGHERDKRGKPDATFINMQLNASLSHFTWQYPLV